MFFEILNHEFKRFVRSPLFNLKLPGLILIGLLFIYSLVVLEFLTQYFYKYFSETILDFDKLKEAAAGLILYYFLLELAARVLIQFGPIGNLSHYLCLPVSKRKLVHQSLLLSVFNLFNFGSFLLLFYISRIFIFPGQDSIESFLWMVGLVLTLLANHFLAIFLMAAWKRYIATLTILLLLLVVLVIGEGHGFFSLIGLSEWLFFGPLYPVFPSAFGMAAILLLYFLNYRGLLPTMAIDFYGLKGRRINSLPIGSDERKGIVLALLKFEWLLIRRNKRIRQTILRGTIVLLLYNLLIFHFIFYGAEKHSIIWHIGLVFFAIAMNAWIIGYGQMATAWESIFYDRIRTLPISEKDYLKSKFLMLVLPTAIIFVIVFPMAFFLWEISLELVAVFFFSIGPVAIYVLFVSIFNQKRVEINQSGAMNFQGTSWIQFFVMLPGILLLMATIIPFMMMNTLLVGWIFWILSGWVCLLCFGILLRPLSSLLKRMQYRKMEAYRKR